MTNPHYTRAANDIRRGLTACFDCWNSPELHEVKEWITKFLTETNVKNS